MPHLHCINCHHEWESVNSEDKCDWCNGDSYILEQKTPLQKMIENSDNLLKKLCKNTN